MKIYKLLNAPKVGLSVRSSRQKNTQNQKERRKCNASTATNSIDQNAEE
jgi:hypothetical protein